MMGIQEAEGAGQEGRVRPRKVVPAVPGRGAEDLALEVQGGGRDRSGLLVGRSVQRRRAIQRGTLRPI